MSIRGLRPVLQVAFALLIQHIIVAGQGNVVKKALLDNCLSQIFNNP